VTATSTTELAVIRPYKGLANFTEDDSAFFFGRDREREIIIANVKARRLTLLYGESGVGKTSLLRAGVAADLLDQARQDMSLYGTAEFIPIVFAAWQHDPLHGLIEAIERGIEEFLGDTPAPAPSHRLEDAIQAAAVATDAYLLIILDQFEEYFLYHGAESGEGSFDQEFPEVVGLAGLQAGFLLSMREDALAKLDRFKSRIPRLFDTFIRIEHLSAEDARDAIVRPVEEFNLLLPADRRVSIEPALVGAVLAQIRTGQVVLEQVGQGAVHHAAPLTSGDDRIETPYLQLVMARIWDEERGQRSRELRVATLAALGGAQTIVRTHVDAVLGDLTRTERYRIADLFHQLVTPSGTKIAHSAADLAEYVGLPEKDVQSSLDRLARPETRIVRAVAPPPGTGGAARYEIFHDVLAPSILDWRTRQTEERRARATVIRRLGRLGIAFAVLAFAAIVVLAIEANLQATRAVNAEHAAASESRSMARQAGVLASKNSALARETRSSDANAAQARRLALRKAVLARRARSAAARARAQERRANRLQAIDRRQTATEKGLATRARRSAGTARLQLRIANESIALSAITPQITANGVDYSEFDGDPAGPRPQEAQFASTVLTHVPAGAVVHVWAPRDPTLKFGPRTVTTGPRSLTIRSLSAEGTQLSPLEDLNVPVAFGVRINFLVTLRDIGWDYQLKVKKIKKFAANPIQVISQGQCRPPGSRDSRLPNPCPTPPQ
jgi:hypothetical protein